MWETIFCNKQKVEEQKPYEQEEQLEPDYDIWQDIQGDIGDSWIWEI